MSSEETIFDGQYTIRLARNLIFVSYQQAGFDVKIERFEPSPIAGDLGPVPRGWNEGLFRYLDETINLINTSEYCLLLAGAINKKDSYKSLTVLTHQIKSNLSAIRLMSTYGLDSQTRIIIRSLYENCVALCRSLIDRDFRERFMASKSIEETNKFWHQNLSKHKSEKALEDYNSKNERKCLLVLGEPFNDIRRKIGVSAHPNFLLSQFEYFDSLKREPNDDKIFPGSEASSEFVLTSSNHIALATLAFVSTVSETICDDAPWIIRTGIFGEFEKCSSVLQSIGKVSGLMQLFLAKWSNRQKASFNPAIHF